MCDTSSLHSELKHSEEPFQMQGPSRTWWEENTELPVLLHPSTFFFSFTECWVEPPFMTTPGRRVGEHTSRHSSWPWRGYCRTAAHSRHCQNKWRPSREMTLLLSLIYLVLSTWFVTQPLRQRKGAPAGSARPRVLCWFYLEPWDSRGIKNDE